jgi:hypothetical protein
MPRPTRPRPCRGTTRTRRRDADDAFDTAVARARLRDIAEGRVALIDGDALQRRFAPLGLD